MEDCQMLEHQDGEDVSDMVVGRETTTSSASTEDVVPSSINRVLRVREKFPLFRVDGCRNYSDLQFGYRRVKFRDVDGCFHFQFCNGDRHWFYYFDEQYHQDFDIMECDIRNCCVFYLRPDTTLPCSMRSLLKDFSTENISTARAGNYFSSTIIRTSGRNCTWFESCDGRTHEVLREGVPAWKFTCDWSMCGVYHIFNFYPPKLVQKIGLFESMHEYDLVRPFLHGVRYTFEGFQHAERCEDDLHVHVQRGLCIDGSAASNVRDCDSAGCAVSLCRPSSQFPIAVRDMQHQLSSESIRTTFDARARRFEHTIANGDSVSRCFEKCDGSWHFFSCNSKTEPRFKEYKIVCTKSCGLMRKRILLEQKHSPASFLKRQLGLTRRH